MGFTLQQIHGTNAIFDDTLPSNLKIIKSINDYRNTPDGDLTGNGINDVSVINDTNINDYSAKIFYGDMLRILKNQPATETDASYGVRINPTPSKTFVTIGGVSVLKLNYTVSIYLPDTFTPDLDDVVTA